MLSPILVPRNGASLSGSLCVSLCVSLSVALGVSLCHRAHIWNASCHGPTHAIHNLIFDGNYHDTAVILNDGVNMTMRRNTLVNGSNFPPKALAIMAAAGPRDSPWTRE